MTMIANTALLVRRLGKARRRQQALFDRKERLRGGLPEWARDPLQLMGLTAMEVDGFLGDRSEADSRRQTRLGVSPTNRTHRSRNSRIDF